MKIRTKIVLLFSLVILLGTAAMGAFSAITMEQSILRSAHAKLKSDLALGRALLDEQYPGGWSVQDGMLYKGDQKMNDNSAAVDLIGQLTGDTVTLFLGDTRVATNVTEDGRRAVGTKVSAEVAEMTLQGGQTFIGEAMVLDTLSQTAYEPIKNAQGEVIGIWYVGVPNTAYEEMIANFRNNVLLFGAGGLLFAIIVSAIVAEWNARPLMRMTNVAKQVADGDLRVEELKVKSKDELGQLSRAVNEMVGNLRTLVEEIHVTAAQVSSASDDLSKSTEQTTRATELITTTIQMVAHGAESQVKGAADSAAAIEEMAHGIHRIAETSVEVAEVSMNTANEAEQGNEQIQNAESQMKMISGTVHLSAEGMKMLEQRSLEIEKIVEVITSIAQQTNLLALNAAIEAARAGEHGKGFSVVADEVRKLAEQSGESAGQISGLIQSIQAEVAKSVASMNAITREVRSGANVVHEAGDAFGRILKSAKSVADQIQDVTAAAEEMSANSQQVADGVDEMTRIARDSANSAEEVAASSEQQLASIEEISASAESLSKMAKQLNDLIGRFHV